MEPSPLTGLVSTPSGFNPGEAHGGLIALQCPAKAGTFPLHKSPAARLPLNTGKATPYPAALRLPLRSRGRWPPVRAGDARFVAAFTLNLCGHNLAEFFAKSAR